MDRLREAASAALSLRDERGLRIRLPLAGATIAGADAELIRPFTDLLADEINVKSIELTQDVAAFGSFRLQPNGRVLGPKLGPEVQTVIKAAKAGEWTSNPDGSVTVADHVLTPDQFELALVPLDGVAAAALPGNNAVVALDTELTPDLEAEGQARDLVRLVQQERKDRDLQVTDRIALRVSLPDELGPTLAPHFDWIKSQVLATELSTGESLPVSGRIGDHEISFDFAVASA
jgi:isoleucyl-tRNA synthetase